MDKNPALNKGLNKSKMNKSRDPALEAVVFDSLKGAFLSFFHHCFDCIVRESLTCPGV